MWPDFSQWTQNGASSANSSQTLTQTAAGSQRHYLCGYLVAVRTADMANDLLIQVKDGSTVILTDAIGAAQKRGDKAGVVFTYPIQISSGNAVSLVVGAGGAGVITEATLWGFTR